MKLDVLGINGSTTGRSIDLPDDIFACEPNEHAVYLAVKQYLANQRQGTHKAKEKGEITGSTKKLKRQKGTGTARAGSIKSPVFRGGGRVFGPRPRSYNIKLNKKVKRLARMSALSDLVSKGQVKVIEDFTFEAPKTAEFATILKNLDCKGKSVLVTGDADNILYLSGRNIPKTKVITAADLNTYQVMNAGTLLLSEGAVQKLVATLS